MSQQTVKRPTLPSVTQLTNPAFALLLTPFSYCLLGFFVAIKSESIPFGSLFVTLLFLFLLNLQEMIFSKFFRVPKTGKSGMLLLTNFLLFLPIIYFSQTYSIRIAMIGVLMVFVNHSFIAHLPSSHAAYPYHIILNGLVKYTLGNVLIYYVMTRQLPTIVFSLFLSFGLFGMSVLHYRQKARERRLEMPITYRPLTAMLSLLFNILVLVAYMVLWFSTHNHYTLVGLILLTLTIGFWGWYHLSLKKSLTAGRVTTYLAWVMIVLSMILGFGFHF